MSEGLRAVEPGRRESQARPGNTNATRHGAYSPRQIKARARAHRRRFLRQAGLRASDLDAVAVGFLDLWARGQAHLDAKDEEGASSEANYWTALNGTRRALEKLEKRLQVLGISTSRGGGADSLETYLEGRRRDGGQ